MDFNRRTSHVSSLPYYRAASQHRMETRAGGKRSNIRQQAILCDPMGTLYVRGAESLSANPYFGDVLLSSSAIC